MQDFMRSLTKTINLKSGRSGRVFGAKYHWSLITNSSYYDCALKYVFRNPVKANLSSTVESYSFSTLNCMFSDFPNSFPVKPAPGYDILIPQNDAIGFLLWLNTPFRSDQEQEVRMALKKVKFAPSKNGQMKRRVSLESSTLRVALGFDAVGTEKESDT